MSAKAFLLQECGNVKELLAHTLKNDYGREGSRDFFDECATRLEFITAELATVADSDTVALGRNGALLNQLASLICRIERSSVGEYSWPFVEELKKIATVVCTESSLTGANTPPKIYVLADGGLDTYAIYAERARPSASKRRLLTIVFPKSLKHFVLLHPILGHEVGHAIWRCSKHQGTLRSSVLSELTDPAGIFANPGATADHMFSSAAPQKMKDYLLRIGISRHDLFSWADWDAWIEEILCDLIGLATFGPSFVAAHAELLYSLDPSGVRFGEEHPPVAWRVNFVRHGAKLLGYDILPSVGNPMTPNVERFWNSIERYQESDAWFDVFTEPKLRNALANIGSLLGNYPPSGYTVPTFGELEHLVSQLLRHVPPIGFSIRENGEPLCRSIDFRHILYAGWIVSQHESAAIPFGLINRLCEHAIMQQGAIDIEVKVA
jgi:hypothetical protein